MMVGTPARQVGWVSALGEKIDLPSRLLVNRRSAIASAFGSFRPQSDACLFESGFLRHGQHQLICVKDPSRCGSLSRTVAPGRRRGEG